MNARALNGLAFFYWGKGVTRGRGAEWAIETLTTDDQHIQYLLCHWHPGINLGKQTIISIRHLQLFQSDSAFQSTRPEPGGLHKPCPVYGTMFVPLANALQPDKTA